MSDGVEYRLCPGLAGYRVGEDGSVWCCRKQGPGGYLADTWRPLKHIIDRYGYHTVCVRKGNDRKWVKVHHLVLEAFVGQCPEGLMGLHNEDDKDDNTVGSLRWGTQPDNDADKKKNGRIACGERVNKAKLTEDDVLSLRYAREYGLSLSALAILFGLKSKSTVKDIVLGRTWKHLL